MKTITIRTLILTLVFALLCVGTGVADAGGVVGTWYLNAVEMNGASINPSVMGMEMTIVLHEGGSADMQMTGDDDTVGTWTVEGETVTIDDGISPAAFTLEGDTLVMAQEGVGKMIFGKEKAEAVAFEAAPIKRVTDVTSFDGVWNGTNIDFAGAIVPIAMAGVELTFTVTGGTVQLHLVRGGTEISGENQWDLIDGALVVSITDGDVSRALKANLLEDGMLAVVLEPETAATTVYCEKAE